MKFVLNKCWGSFEVSDIAAQMLDLHDRWEANDLDRDDPDLVKAIETLGEIAASGNQARLCVVEVPDDITDWELYDFAGVETLVYVKDGKIYHA